MALLQDMRSAIAVTTTTTSLLLWSSMNVAVDREDVEDRSIPLPLLKRVQEVKAERKIRRAVTDASRKLVLRQLPPPEYGIACAVVHVVASRAHAAGSEPAFPLLLLVLVVLLLPACTSAVKLTRLRSKRRLLSAIILDLEAGRVAGPYPTLTKTQGPVGRLVTQHL